MPFKSESQRKALWAKDPELAKKFEKETPKGKKIPEKVKKLSGCNKPEKKVKMSTSGETRQQGFAKISKSKKCLT